ncbi:MAG: hypothetical protein AAF662_09530, partial [Pseudomonadota bacterium]
MRWWRRYREYTDSLISPEQIASEPLKAHRSPYSPPVRFLRTRVFLRASIAIILNDPLRFVGLCALDVALLWLPQPYGLISSLSLALGAVTYNALRAHEVMERITSYPTPAPKFVPAGGITPYRPMTDAPVRVRP